MSGMAGLTEGRIVHYVTEDKAPGNREIAHCQAAIVVQVFRVRDAPPESGCSNLTVFGGWANDGPDACGLQWKTSRVYSETIEPYTWHWPQECRR